MSQNFSLYRFGIFELDLERWRLTREGREVPLQDQPLRLLKALVEQPGALVSRESLQQALWEPGTHVDFEAGINSAVRRLREALQDRADNPRFVQTVPRQGYRFIAPVEGRALEGPSGSSFPTPVRHLPEAMEPQTPTDLQDASKRPLPPRWMLASLVLVGLVAAGWIVAAFFLPRRSTTTAPSGLTAPVTASASTTAASREGLDPHLQRAHHFADRRSREGLQKAIAEYQSALAADPLRADVYAGLATSYVILGAYDYWRPRDAFEPARRMAERALELDGSSPEALMALSAVTAMADWNWPAAENLVDQALALDPTLEEGHLWRAILLSFLGRHDEALAAIERALALAPVSPVLNTAKGWLLFQARRFTEAVDQTHAAIELAPDYFDAWDNLKWILFTTGEEADGVRAWARADSLEGKDGQELLERYPKEGLDALFRSSVEAQLRRNASRYASPFDLVLDYTTLGEISEALDWLERSFAERETDLLGLAVDPRLDPLRREPRFQAILGRLQLSGRQQGT